MVLKKSGKQGALGFGRIKLPHIPSEISFHVNTEFIYLALYMLYSFGYVINESLINFALPMKLIKLAASLGLTVLYLLKRRYTFQSFTVAIVVTVVYLLSARMSDRMNLLYYALFIINADLTNFRNIAKCSILSTFTTTIMVMLMAKVGLLPDYLFLRGTVWAHCMGFDYYSTYPYILLFNMLSYMYLKQDRLNILHLLVMLAGNYYLYRLSTLRLTFYLTILILIAYVLLVKLRLWNLNNRIFKRLLLLWYPAMFGLAVYSSLHYYSGNSFWRKLNELLSDRLRLQSEAFSLYRVKPFGQVIELHSMVNGMIAKYNYFYIDSGFIFALLGYGIVFTLMLVAIYSFLLYRSCEKNDVVAVIWLGALAAFTVINNVWNNITYNCIIMMLMLELTGKQNSHGNLLELLKGFLYESKKH